MKKMGRALAPLAALLLVTSCAGEGEPEPMPTVTETVTATPEPAPTVTVTAEPNGAGASDTRSGSDALEEEIIGDPELQEMFLNDMFYGISEDEQASVCRLWQSDMDGAAEDFAADGDLPVTEDVFRDWATFTCG